MGIYVLQYLDNRGSQLNPEEENEKKFFLSHLIGQNFVQSDILLSQFFSSPSSSVEFSRRKNQRKEKT